MLSPNIMSMTAVVNCRTFVGTVWDLYFSQKNNYYRSKTVQEISKDVIDDLAKHFNLGEESIQDVVIAMVRELKCTFLPESDQDKLNLKEKFISKYSKLLSIVSC